MKNYYAYMDNYQMDYLTVKLMKNQVEEKEYFQQGTLIFGE